MIEIRELRREDRRKAIGFAIRGMHFDWYLDSPLLLRAYGRYFWYLELNRATQVLAAYEGGRFLGVLLAEIYGEPPVRRVWWQRMYVKAADLIQKLFFRGGAGLYEETTKAQLAHYLWEHRPDGELIFLAADPDAGVPGVGTALLAELARREAGKTIYLYTDDACTYQFYEHRGFRRAEEERIVLKLPKGDVPLTCLLYEKKL